jgi:hypothetical protein
LNAGKLFPRVATIGRLVNGKVDLRRFWGIVLPCCKDVAVGELGGTGVEYAGIVVVGRRCPDSDAREG